MIELNILIERTGIESFTISLGEDSGKSRNNLLAIFCSSVVVKMFASYAFSQLPIAYCQSGIHGTIGIFAGRFDDTASVIDQ